MFSCPLFKLIYMFSLNIRKMSIVDEYMFSIWNIRTDHKIIRYSAYGDYSEIIADQIYFQHLNNPVSSNEITVMFIYCHYIIQQYLEALS